jgi:hypothetical protein
VAKRTTYKGVQFRPCEVHLAGNLVQKVVAVIELLSGAFALAT